MPPDRSLLQSSFLRTSCGSCLTSDNNEGTSGLEAHCPALSESRTSRGPHGPDSMTRLYAIGKRHGWLLHHLLRIASPYAHKSETLALPPGAAWACRACRMPSAPESKVSRMIGRAPDHPNTTSLIWLPSAPETLTLTVTGFWVTCMVAASSWSMVRTTHASASGCSNSQLVPADWHT